MKDWMRVVLASLLILGISLTSFVPPSEVYAAKPPERQVETEVLWPDETRVDKYTKIKKVREYEEHGKRYIGYQMEISSLPETLDDLKTLITCEWREGVADDGIPYFDTGNNLYTARVTGGRVSFEYENTLASWEPQIFVGDVELPCVDGPTLARDPINKNYDYNTIQWTYEVKTGIWLLTEKKITVTRYIRQIEGELQEYYILEKNPGGDVKIVSNYLEEAGFKWEGEVFAWDAEGKTIPIEGDANEKKVSQYELRNPAVVYPVTIDPTTTIATSAYDGEISETDSSYTTARTSSTGFIRNSSVGLIGQYLVSGSYCVNRFMVFFDTNPLPDDAVIDAGSVKVHGYADGADTDFYITIRSGMSTYPHMPPVTGDYYYLRYSGEGGEFYTGGFSATQYNTINLNDTGKGWINKTGWTKFMLISSRDISGTTPSGYEFVTIYEYSQGKDYQPKLYLEYSVPTTLPVINTLSATNEEETSATLRGSLSDDGGADCTVRFKYGTTTGYGSYTSSIGGMNSGDSWETPVYGLAKGTLYHYTALASNSEGNSVDDDGTFLTEPDEVTGVTITPGDTQNKIDWTKGTGSDTTVIRRSTSGYPSSPTDGTGVYDGGLATYTDTFITNGVTYYYSIFAYKTDGGLEQYSGRVTIAGTPFVVGPSTCTTYSATNVEATTATLNGYLNDLGGQANADCYFEYYQAGEGAWAHSTIGDKDVLTATGIFGVDIVGLNADTLTYVRAVTDNGDVADPTNGSTVTFTTGEPSAPTITTVSSSGVAQTQATLYGKVTADGSASVTVYFQWGESTEYGEETGIASGLATGDSFDVTIYDLTPGTTYHFRAVGYNSAGTGYGDDDDFTTGSPDAPTVEARPASNVGASEALLHGLLTDDGGVPCNTRFHYSTTGAFLGEETTTSWMEDYLTGSSFEYLATNLTVDQKYYFRGEAYNSAGSINSTALDFTTVFAAPANFQAIPNTQTSALISWTSIGDKTLVRVKIGSFPADRLDGEQAYFGPGSSTSYGGLTPGVNYFFRAWSWREGDVYSAAYAEDACASPGGSLPGPPGLPSLDFPNPEGPSWWFQTPSSDNIQSWPGVGLVDSTADDLGMTGGYMWTIVSGIILMAVGLGCVSIGSSLLITVIVVGFAMGVLSMIGLMPGWFVVGYLLIIGGLAFTLQRT